MCTFYVCVHPRIILSHLCTLLVILSDIKYTYWLAMLQTPFDSKLFILSYYLIPIFRYQPFKNTRMNLLENIILFELY